MNAHTDPLRMIDQRGAAQERANRKLDLECEGRTLATAILSGNLPLADWPIFTDEDWRREAQGALDTGDYTELLAMRDSQDEADREEEYDRRREYSGRAPMHRDWMEA